MNDRIPTLGRLRSVDLREVWDSEPASFTPWLAAPENLQLLAEALGLPALELVQMERAIDIFSADIVARAPDTGETVLIENQIERSDHTHLGQILTYAAGLDAAVVVWIAKRFTEGHRAALDWLNRITTEQFAFFGVEIDAVRIDDSKPAPRFTVVARPNNWARKAKLASAQAEMTAEARDFIAYWSGYETAAQGAGAPLRVAASPVKSTNYYVRVGDTGEIYVTAARSLSSGRLSVYIAIFGKSAGEIFGALLQKRAEIEQLFGSPLEWVTRREGATYWIAAAAIKADADESDWPRQYSWLTTTMKRLRDSILPFLNTIEIAEVEDV